MKNNIRKIFQFTTLGLITYVVSRPLVDSTYGADVEQYCPFGGLSSFFSKLNLDTMACSMSETQVMLGFALLLGTGVIGKLFCSHICPIGTVTEWIGVLGRHLTLQREMPARADRVLRSLKYVLLFLTVYFTMTGSELFCKTYDPFFATATMFGNGDIVLVYAIAAVVLTLGGALFFRLFWCRYLCPLGAFSNIFLNAAAAGTVVALYGGAYLFGFHADPLWLLGALVLIGLVTELGFMRSMLLPIPRITRNEAACSQCSHCDDNCPQGIRISTMSSVRHIDCTLCTDCAYTCPLKNVVTVDRTPQHKYLAPAAALVLVASALITAHFVEFTTISMRWGGTPVAEGMLLQTGMKSITCYGSSMALAGTLESVPGIVGVDTYAKSHTVKVYYDSSLISRRSVAAALFAPTKRQLRTPALPPQERVGVFDIGMLHLFDAVDYKDLGALLSEQEGVLGFETRFGEPVRLTVYYLPSKLTSAAIRELLKRKYVLRDAVKAPIAIETADAGITGAEIGYAQYRSTIFIGYDDTFNDYDTFDGSKLSTLTFVMSEASDPELRGVLDALASHLSKDDGVVRFRTFFDGAAKGCVYYDGKSTNAAAIVGALTAKELTYYVSEKETESIPNPFHIDMHMAAHR